MISVLLLITLGLVWRAPAAPGSNLDNAAARRRRVGGPTAAREEGRGRRKAAGPRVPASSRQRRLTPGRPASAPAGRTGGGATAALVVACVQEGIFDDYAHSLSIITVGEGCGAARSEFHPVSPLDGPADHSLQWSMEIGALAEVIYNVQK